MLKTHEVYSLNPGWKLILSSRRCSGSEIRENQRCRVQITQVRPDMEHEEAKDMLLTEIDTFIQEKITYADKSVADLAASKIENKDVVLTFAFSSAVLNTFLKAREVIFNPKFFILFHLLYSQCTPSLIIFSLAIL